MAELASTGGPAAKKGNKWLALAACTLAFMYTFLTRFIWTSLSRDISAQFGMDSGQVALYMSMFFAGYLITQLPGGILADALQPKWIMIICTLLSAGATALMSMMNGYVMGLVLRILTGIASGCVMACCSKIVALNFPGPSRATGMGILLAAPPIGITLANQLGPRLNASMGWANTFLVTAGIGVLIAVIVLFFAPTVPKIAPDPSRPKTGLLQGMKAYFTDGQQLIGGVSGFMFMFVNVGFATWAMSYAQAVFEYTPVQAGTIVTAYSVAGIVGSFFSGKIAQLLKMSHKQFLLLSLVLMTAATLVFNFMTSYTTLMIVGAVYGFVSYLPSTHYTTLAQMRAGDRYAASATSAQNLIFQSSGLVQPIIISAVVAATGNQQMIWYVFAACLALAVVITLFIKEPKKAGH